MRKDHTLHSAVIFTIIICYLFIEHTIIQCVNNINDNVCLLPYRGYLMNILTLLACIIFVICLIISKTKQYFKLRKSVLQQLITGSLGARWDTLVIVLFFIAHLSWSVDSGYEVLFGISQDPKSISSLILSFIGIFISIGITPVVKSTVKDIKDADIFLSAFSTGKEITFKNLDLLLKPFYNTGVSAESGNKGLFNISKFILIYSASAQNKNIFTSRSDWDTIICNLKGGAKSNEITYEELCKNIDAYNSHPSIKGLISILSKLIDVEFILPNNATNYDDFVNIKENTSTALKKAEMEIQNCHTVIHISPGTAITTSALTSLGIKKNRTILYTNQSSSEVNSVDISTDSIADILNELFEEKEEIGHNS